MSATLTQDIADLLDAPDTVKVLATLDAQGHPYTSVKKSLHRGDDGNIHLLEIFESSNTGRNLLRSLWFDHKLSITLLGNGGRQVEIKGRPVKCHISGPLFLHHYAKIRERLGDVDLAAVWVIEPENVVEKNFEQRKAQETQERPTFIHLDRLLKEAENIGVSA